MAKEKTGPRKLEAKLYPVQPCYSMKLALKQFHFKLQGELLLTKKV